MKDKKRGIDIPKEFLDAPEIKEAIAYLEESSFSPAQLDYYDRYWDFVSRERTLREDSEEKVEKGFLQGKEIGREEGEKVGI
jgi:hypothetical protein